MIIVKFTLHLFIGNVVWLNDRLPTKALLNLTRPIRELKHLTSAVDDQLTNEDFNTISNDDHMDQDDVCERKIIIPIQFYRVPTSIISI